MKKKTVKQLIQWAKDTKSKDDKYVQGLIDKLEGKPERPLNRWYVVDENAEFWDEDNQFLFFFNQDYKGYGLNSEGVWLKESSHSKMANKDSIENDLRLATEEEILSKLSAYAEKMGYKEGDFECLNFGQCTKRGSFEDFSYYKDNDLWIDFEYFSFCIMQDGIWADIIQPKKLSDVIEKYEERDADGVLDDFIKELKEVKEL